MREFPFRMMESLKKGLRGFNTYRDEDNTLEVMTNMAPGEEGAVALSACSDPFNGGLTVDFPFPQMFRARKETLMFSATTLYSVNTGVTPWTRTAQDLYLSSTGSTAGASIVTGGVWDFVDLGDSWYAFNGESMVFQTGLDYLLGQDAKVYSSPTPKINAACYHKGRMWLGGFETSDSEWLFSDAVWDDILAELKQDMGLQDNELPFGTKRPGGNFVFWSGIGGGDFPLWFSYPVAYGQLGLGPSKEAFLTKLRANQLGWAPLPYNGTIQVMKPLGNHIIAYGTEGITAIKPDGAVVGFKEVSMMGVAGRGSVGGDSEGHIFIDQGGTLWSLGVNLSLDRLGYQEYLGTFPVTSTVITSRESPREFTLSSPDDSFQLTDQGLGKATKSITSSFYLAGEQIAMSSSNTTSPLMSIQSGSFRNTRQAIKMIHDVQVDYVGITDLTVSVLTKFTPNGAYQTIGPRIVNDAGVATFTTAGLEFKILLSGTPTASAVINAIEVRWNLTDYRSLRGLFNTQDNQQS